MIIALIYQEEIVILNIYAAKNRYWKYTKQKLLESQGEIRRWQMEFLISLFQWFIEMVGRKSGKI